MQIHPIESRISDNWFYLLADDDGDDGVLIDPVDAPTALRVAGELGIVVSRVVNTHWHPDHTSGNGEVLQATGAELYVPEQEQSLIEGDAELLRAGDVLEVGDDKGEVLLTPGHTHGHISLHFGNRLFSGDGIFVGGAGNCYTGCPKVLYRTFRDVFGSMPDEVVFYPGHDYAVRNLEFCLSVDPENTAAGLGLNRHSGKGLCLTTLGDERRYNPFFRSDDHDLQSRIRGAYPDIWDGADAQTAAERTFVVLRALRNKW